MGMDGHMECANLFALCPAELVPLPSCYSNEDSATSRTAGSAPINRGALQMCADTMTHFPGSRQLLIKATNAVAGERNDVHRQLMRQL